MWGGGGVIYLFQNIPPGYGGFSHNGPEGIKEGGGSSVERSYDINVLTVRQNV